MDKINFKKFIWLYWKMKQIYICIFLGGFPVVGMKKKYVEKKKRGRKQQAGLLPILHLVTIQCTVS